MIDVREIELAGNRVLRVGSYRIDHGDEVELRAFISTDWKSAPVLPFKDAMTDIPMSAMGDVIEALNDVVTAKQAPDKQGSGDAG